METTELTDPFKYLLAIVKSTPGSTKHPSLIIDKTKILPPEKEETWAEFKAGDEKIASYDEAANFSLTCPFSHTDTMADRLAMYRSHPNHTSIKCRDCKPRNHEEYAITDQNRYESARAIAANLFTETIMPNGTVVTPAMKQRVGKADNPWWQQCTTEEKAKVLSEYPEFSRLVGLGAQEGYWRELKGLLYDTQ